MCDEALVAFGGSRANYAAPGPSGGRADEQVTRHGYDAHGNRYSRTTRRAPTKVDMQNYTGTTDDEARYEAPPREYRSPFGSSNPGRAPVRSGARDEFDANELANLGSISGAAATPSVPAPAPASQAPSKDWNIENERGMHAGLCVLFSGSPAQFAAEKAPIKPVDKFSGSSEDSKRDTFNPTKMHFSREELVKDLRAPGRTKVLTDEKALLVSKMAAQNDQILPLAVTVRDYHNPFSFPLGVRASHEPLNRVRFNNSAQKYMVVLMPGGTNRADKTIDLRGEVNVNNIHMAACLSEQDISRQFKPSGSKAPDLVMVERDSMLHDSILKLHSAGHIPPIDWNATTDVDTHGGSYVDGIPKDAAMRTIERLQAIQRNKHGKLSVNEVSFTLHPLNFQGRWNNHHLSGASYDQANNSALYEEFMQRPAEVVVNMHLEYL